MTNKTSTRRDETPLQFSYNQRVDVTTGFFNGFRGTIIDYERTKPEEDSYQRVTYVVDLDHMNDKITVEQRNLQIIPWYSRLYEKIFGTPR